MTDIQGSHCRVACLAALIFTVGVSSVRAEFISVIGDVGDGVVDVNGLPQDFTLDPLRVGVGGNNLRGLADIFFFALPTVPSPAAIVAAQLQFEFLGQSDSSFPTVPEFNVDLFGIGARATADIQASDYYDGATAGSTDSLIQASLLTPSSIAGTLTISNASLLSFVQSLYNPDGTPIAAFAVFRLNPDKDLPVNSGSQIRGYDIASADNTDESLRPRLDLTTVPEPSSFAMLSGLAVMFAGYWGWRRHRQSA